MHWTPESFAKPVMLANSIQITETITFQQMIFSTVAVL